jgi:hypothetical protein
MGMRDDKGKEHARINNKNTDGVDCKNAIPVINAYSC